jgi:hypothetical protein
MPLRIGLKRLRQVGARKSAGKQKGRALKSTNGVARPQFFSGLLLLHLPLRLQEFSRELNHLALESRWLSIHGLLGCELLLLHRT